MALGALLIGVEDEAIGPMTLQEHHSSARITRGIRRSQCHRLGVVGLAYPRFGEPVVEQLKWVRDHLGRALGLASRIEQPIWSAMNDCGMGATWHSTFTNGWA